MARDDGKTLESMGHAPGCDGWREHDCGDSTCGIEKERCPGCETRPAWPPANDPRFTFGLMFDVVDVLVKHGYRVTDEDRGKLRVRVQQGLYEALYGEGSNER